MTKITLTGENLSKILAKDILKKGYFMLTSRSSSDYWIDLYSLSRIFNVYSSSDEYRCFLSNKMKGVIKCGIETESVNSIIIPRWTCSTEDLFSETLLNAWLALRNEEEFKSIKTYELFSAGGGNDDYYLCRVKDESDIERDTNDTENKIIAIAFLALDIHSWIIDSLLEANPKTNKNDEQKQNDIEIPIVISVIGRCGQFPKTKLKKTPNKGYSSFKIFPIFNASGFENKAQEEYREGFKLIYDDDNLKKELFVKLKSGGES